MALTSWFICTYLEDISSRLLVGSRTLTEDIEMTETTWLVQPLFTGIFMVLGLLLFYQTLGKTVARLTQHNAIKINFRKGPLFVYSVAYWTLVSGYVQYRIGLTNNALGFLNFGILILFYVLLYLGIRGLAWVAIGTMLAQILFLNGTQMRIDNAISTVIMCAILVGMTVLVNRSRTGLKMLIVAVDILDVCTWGVLLFVKLPGVSTVTPHMLWDNWFAFIVMNAALIYTQTRLNDDNTYIWNVTTRATVDALTQIPNFGTFRNELQKDYDHYYDTDDVLTMITLDVDHFKSFNDQYGHLAGNQILRSVGHFLSDVVSPFPGAVACRVGGEEFNLLLPNVTLDRATRIAKGMQARMAEQVIHYNEHRMSITISLGVAQLSHQDEQATDFYQRADELLYQAKAQGRNCVASEMAQR